MGGGAGRPADSLYSRAYFLADCEGWEEFLRTSGRKLPKRLAKCLALLDPRPGEIVADVGCGRGEVCLHAAARGASAIALDPSRAALELAAEATRAWKDLGVFPEGAPRGPWRVLGCGRALPFRPGKIDKILLADVLEHLERSEQEETLRECARALRPGGTIAVHTQPNRTLLRWTFPALRRLSPLWGVRLPRDPRSEASPGAGLAYHRGELSRSRLERILRRAGLEPREVWLEGTWAIHRIFGDLRLKGPLIRVFRRSEVLRRLFATQVFAAATKGPPA